MRHHLWVVVALCGPGCTGKDCRDLTPFFEDRDNDGYGNPSQIEQSCTAPEGYVDVSGDCDDRDHDVYPGAAETCGDGKVNDCDSTEAEAAASCTLSGEVAASAASTATFTGDAGAALGASVASAGDLDDDDTDELLIGAPGDDEAGEDAGAALLYYGGLSGELGSGDVASKITGEEAGDQAGAAVASPGDVSDDGDSDLLVGAPGASDGVGRIYLLTGDVDTSMSLVDADVVFTGESASQGVGSVLAGLGDIDGDGQGDVAVGAPDADAHAGRVWLLTDLEDSASLADEDRQLLGEADEDFAGSAVIGADLDGDGEADVLVGAPGALQGGSGGAGKRNGAIYGVFDKVSDPTSLIDADTRIYGETEDALFGAALASLGDATGDGYDDIAVSSPGQGSAALAGGAVYVLPGPLELTNFAVVASFASVRIDGEVEDGAIGTALAGPGDMDGDGSADLALSCSGDDSAATDAGAVYVLLGPFSGTVGVDRDHGTSVETGSALKAEGEAASTLLGAALAGVGDQDGNGTAELLAGGPGAGGAWLLRASGY